MTWLFYVHNVPLIFEGGNIGKMPPKGDLTLTGYPPTVMLPSLIEPGAGQLDLTGYDPNVILGNLAMPSPPGALNITGYAPTIIGGYNCAKVYSAIYDLSPLNYWYFPQYNTDRTSYSSDASSAKKADSNYDLIVETGTTSYHNFGNLPSDFVTCTYQRLLNSSNTGSDEGFIWAPSLFDADIHDSLSDSGTVMTVMNLHEAATNYTWMGFRCTGNTGPKMYNTMQYYYSGGDYATRVRASAPYTGGPLWAINNISDTPLGYGVVPNMWVQTITWQNSWSASPKVAETTQLTRTQMSVYINDKGAVSSVDHVADDGWWSSSNPPRWSAGVTGGVNGSFRWTNNGSIVATAIWDSVLSESDISSVFTALKNNYVTLPSYYQ